MFLTIVLRKEVPNEAQGIALYEIVKQKLSDHPEVKISGNVNNPLPEPEPEPG